MIEVRLTTDHDDYWELKYMLDDAKEKAANKQFDELTEMCIRDRITGKAGRWITDCITSITDIILHLSLIHI